MIPDTEAVLQESAEQIDGLRSLYEQSLSSQELPERLVVKVKNVLENQRSALEYVAHAVVAKHGTSGRSYFPLAETGEQFPNLAKRHLPGVTETGVLAAVETHQPYQSGHEALHLLRDLTNENKHRLLTPQIRTETRRREVHGPSGSVTWDPGAVSFGSGVTIGGERVDPVTQRTSSTRDITYVDWLFEDYSASALGTLLGLQELLPGIATDICEAAGL